MHDCNYRRSCWEPGLICGYCGQVVQSSRVEGFSVSNLVSAVDELLALNNPEIERIIQNAGVRIVKEEEDEG